MITTILGSVVVLAGDLSDLYELRWETEAGVDELKTDQGGRGVVPQSETPRGVFQEICGRLRAHSSIRP